MGVCWFIFLWRDLPRFTAIWCDAVAGLDFTPVGSRLLPLTLVDSRFRASGAGVIGSDRESEVVLTVSDRERSNEE